MRVASAFPYYNWNASNKNTIGPLFVKWAKLTGVEECCLKAWNRWNDVFNPVMRIILNGRFERKIYALSGVLPIVVKVLSKSSGR